MPESPRQAYVSVTSTDQFEDLLVKFGCWSLTGARHSFYAYGVAKFYGHDPADPHSGQIEVTLRDTRPSVADMKQYRFKK